MSSNSSGEGQIRESMIKGDVVEVMIALPGQLFLNTQIPVCLWFLTNDKSKNGRDRRNETLFIDARSLGTMKTRVLKVLTDKDIQKITQTVFAWKKNDNYQDVKGFCKSCTIKDIENNNFILTPSRYVGFADEDDDNISFEEKIKFLNQKYNEFSSKSEKINRQIQENLKKIFS